MGQGVVVGQGRQAPASQAKAARGIQALGDALRIGQRQKLTERGQTCHLEAHPGDTGQPLGVPLPLTVLPRRLEPCLQRLLEVTLVVQAAPFEQRDQGAGQR